jgi:hypothetical protein
MDGCPGVGLLIVFVLLKSGELRVYSGFDDITDEYYQTSENEAQNVYPEAFTTSQESRWDDSGISPESEALRREIYFFDDDRPKDCPP